MQFQVQLLIQNQPYGCHQAGHSTIGLVCGQLSILIADDNSLFRKALRQTVEAHEDWTICGEAQDGFEAIAQATKYKPDLVLLDFVMPNLDGLHAAARISGLLPGTAIIMITLHDSPTLRAEAKRFGILEVIPKSDCRSLIGTIEALLQTKRTPNTVDAEELPTTTKSNSRQLA